MVIKKPLFRRFLKVLANFLTPSPPDFKSWERKNILLRLTGLNISKEGVAIDSGFSCLTTLEENITIDDYCAIGCDVKFWNFNEISLGKFCMIAAGTHFVNGSHDKNTFEPFSGALNIGSGCWIGSGARIVGPLTIGDNATVGAGVLVIRDVPAGSIVAGVPAKIIGMRELPKKVWHLGNNYFCPYTFKLID